MASKRKSKPKAKSSSTRKRTNRAYRPDGFLWVGLVLNLVAGFVLSPMTAITRVRVLGAEPFDRQRLQTQLEALGGKPVASITPRSVESGVTDAPEVRDVDFSRNWFGRAQLKITYRKPVAKITGSKSLYLSDEGVLYTSRQRIPVLPYAELPAAANLAALTYASEAPLQPLAELCLRIPAPIEPAMTTALYHPEDGLCLNTGEASALVIFGPAERMDEKLITLGKALRDNHRLLVDNSQINLIVPEKAARTPIVSSSSQSPALKSP